MGMHLIRKRRHCRTLSAARLSEITWSAADRRAWLDAYEAARRCATVRYMGAEGFPAGAHSVHVDILREREG